MVINDVVQAVTEMELESVDNEQFLHMRWVSTWKQIDPTSPKSTERKAKAQLVILAVEHPDLKLETADKLHQIRN